MAMSQWVGLVVGVVIVLALVAGAVALSQQREEGDASRLTVAATIFPLADIVKQVGGERVNVVLIIPPGVTEHTSVLTPQQLSQLQGAKAIFQIGNGLDDHLVEKITQTFSEVRPAVVDSGITLQEFAESEEEHHHDEGADPHYWLTVPNAIKITQIIAQEMAELDPEHAPEYQANTEAYEEELQRLEAELQTQAASVSPKEFIAMHNAWSYFADHYGFTLVGTYEPTEGKEPSLQDLQALRQLVQQYGLKTFYAEPQKSSGAVSEFMQREFGLKVLTLDPVGGVEGRDTYITLMRFNMGAIAEGAR